MASLVGKWVASGRQSRIKEMPRYRAWILASRPRTLTAAAAPVVVGTGLAIGRDGYRFLPALAALVAAFLIQVGTNLANDYYDHVRGGDTEDRVGPIRVTQAGIIPPRTVRNVAFFVLGLALLLGIYLVMEGGIAILLIGIASLICAVAYTGGPFPLAYNALGDFFVFFFFGLAAVGGTFWVQALSFGSEVVLAGTGIGALATAILVANNLRDIETDAKVGKRTLAVRMGREWTKVEYVALLVVAAVVPVVGVLYAQWGVWTLLTLLTGVRLRDPLLTVISASETSEPALLIGALEKTAQATGVYGLVLGISLALS